jgi:hypothetical protein
MASFGRGEVLGKSRVYVSKCGAYRIRKRNSSACYILCKVVVDGEVVLSEHRSLADAKWAAEHAAFKPA